MNSILLITIFAVGVITLQFWYKYPYIYTSVDMDNARIEKEKIIAIYKKQAIENEQIYKAHMLRLSEAYIIEIEEQDKIYKQNLEKLTYRDIYEKIEHKKYKN